MGTAGVTGLGSVRAEPVNARKVEAAVNARKVEAAVNARKVEAAVNASKVPQASVRPANVAPSRKAATTTVAAGEIRPDRPRRGQPRTVKRGPLHSHRFTVNSKTIAGRSRDGHPTWRMCRTSVAVRVND